VCRALRGPARLMSDLTAPLATLSQHARSPLAALRVQYTELQPRHRTTVGSYRMPKLGGQPPANVKLHLTSYVRDAEVAP
jgi:hypothetical protein